MAFEIRPIKNKYYPLEVAIQKAAEQNVRRDHASHLISEDSLEAMSEEGRRKYLTEATRVITEFGVNYVPAPPEDERIHCHALFYLPLEEAIERAAQQLVTHDHSLGILAVGDINDLPYDKQARYTTIASNAMRKQGYMVPPSNDLREQYFVKN